MEELMKMLGGIQHLRTSPYHPEMGGMRERHNGTLKSMLKKNVRDTKKWDSKHRTFFSPTGKNFTPSQDFLLRTSIRVGRDRISHVLRETWTAGKKADQSVVSFVQDVRR